MTLFLTLSDAGELALEHDYNDSREKIITDTGGPTNWEIDPALELPERVNDLMRMWIKDALDGSQPPTGKILAIWIDYSTENIIDDR